MISSPVARTLAPLFACAMLSTSCGGYGTFEPSTTNHPLMGKPAPELTAEAVGGEGPKTLAGARGKVVIIDFWGTFCEPCKEAFPAYQALSEKHHGDLAIVGVSIDEADYASKEKLLAFAAETHARFPILWDKDHRDAEVYDLRSLRLPATFVLDRAGNVRHIHVSFPSGEAARIAAEVDALLK